jgi:hypothetical protein
MKRSEITTNLADGRENFLKLIQDIPVKQMEIPGVIDNWSVKDILVHLTRWEAELVKLLWQAENGSKPTTVHFGPDSVDEVNARWFESSQTRTLQLILQDFRGVRIQTIRRVEALPEKILNDPRAFPWLKNKPLWQWIAEDSYEHEAEHEAQIKTWFRKVKE